MRSSWQNISPTTNMSRPERNSPRPVNTERAAPTRKCDAIALAYNNDVQDAWQWADDPRYPHELINLALRLGVNVAMYSMTH